MDSRDGKKQIEASTTAEKISAHVTIAAAALGLISDGCSLQTAVPKGLHTSSLYKGFKCCASWCDHWAAVRRLGVRPLWAKSCARLHHTAHRPSAATLGTVAHGAHGSAKGLFWFLTFARGLTGIGVGGEYPAASTSVSEAANEQMPMFIMVTNFVLALGSPLASSVFLSRSLNRRRKSSFHGLAYLLRVWDIPSAWGAGLPVKDAQLQALSQECYQEKGTLSSSFQALLEDTHWYRWFIYDFVAFPNVIFSGTIISSVIRNGDMKKIAEWQLLLSSITFPGIFIGALLCNPLGRRNVMILGFSCYLLFALIIGLAYEKITKITPLFVIFYGLLQSSGLMNRPAEPKSQAAGMILLVSAESYATPIRYVSPEANGGKVLIKRSGTYYGISAAIGKAGAAIGVQAFAPIQTHLGTKWSFIIAAIGSFAGILVTYFFVPDMTGVDLADEDARFMEYLEINGWEGVVGEDEDRDLIGREPSTDILDSTVWTRVSGESLD
ncbi:MFS Git1p-like glycerophosphoinositol permease [Lactarius pseudohatsudake]|nr:MFS Git1p-like glycerophosphoinositol permease [Lactarius pseudohatsudake]